MLIAANRDELGTRPALPPARHWPDRGDVVAGHDLMAGGSWAGVNDEGLFAGVLNRLGTLGPEAGKRSRGELVLDALDHPDAASAAEALAELDPGAYRPFNLIVADRRDAHWIRNDGSDVRVVGIKEGFSMITARDLDDLTSARIRRYRRLFAMTIPPDPGSGDWSDWQLLLGSPASETGDPRDAMCIHTEGPYGTQSSSLIALPAGAMAHPIWLYADGPPDRAPFEPIDLSVPV